MIQILPIMAGATMFTIGLIAFVGLDNIIVTPARYSYDEQFWDSAVDDTQAAVRVFGSIDILVPTITFELYPGNRVTTLGPTDQLQRDVAQPSHTSTREHAKQGSAARNAALVRDRVEC